jgi:rare lipoprotein A
MRGFYPREHREHRGNLLINVKNSCRIAFRNSVFRSSSASFVSSVVKLWAPASTLTVALLLAGCGHKQRSVRVPAPPEIDSGAPTAPNSVPNGTRSAAKAAKKPSSGVQNAVNLPPISVPDGAKPLYTQLGIASWYGPPYHNRRGANGQIYDMNQMTAAHRTLPLNSIVRVTNVKTGNSALVRITDRGPFIGERMLDLSLAAAKAVDVWGPGLAWVRMDVLQTPAPLDTGGRWCVQIGAFDTAHAATEMKQEILERYPASKVLEFAGPTGEWVRIRVQNDDREQAETMSKDISTPQGGVFLVRLD